MGFILNLFSCFSGSSTVRVDGIEEIGVLGKTQIVDGDQEAKSKSRKGALIPMSFFPLGSNLSRL